MAAIFRSSSVKSALLQKRSSSKAPSTPCWFASIGRASHRRRASSLSLSTRGLVVLGTTHTTTSASSSLWSSLLGSSSSSAAAAACSFSTTKEEEDDNNNNNKPTLVFDKVGVIGLGLMGHGIAQVAAMAMSTSNSSTATIVAYEAQDAFLERGKSRIESSLQRMVQKSKLTQEQMDDILTQRLQFTTNMNDLHDCPLIVEAVIENIQLKRDLYEQLGTICSPAETIYASNTSSLSITDMAQHSNAPQHFCGIHFFNPVPVMKLVEIIHTQYTDSTVIDRVTQWVQDDLKKVPVTCGDTPGFIVNRLLVPALMQSMLMLDRNDASVKDIDIAMQLGAGHPMGPLHLADYIGLDTCLYIVQGWVDKYPNEPAFCIPKCLHEKVENGHLGRKSGQGFYHWDGDKRLDPVTK